MVCKLCVFLYRWVKELTLGFYAIKRSDTCVALLCRKAVDRKSTGFVDFKVSPGSIPRGLRLLSCRKIGAVVGRPYLLIVIDDNGAQREGCARRIYLNQNSP